METKPPEQLAQSQTIVDNRSQIAIFANKVPQNFEVLSQEVQLKILEIVHDDQKAEWKSHDKMLTSSAFNTLFRALTFAGLIASYSLLIYSDIKAIFDNLVLITVAHGVAFLSLLIGSTVTGELLRRFADRYFKRK